ncbi:hypothetical protein BH10PAT3_BH10PAT3_1110 [soil metagenome]
MIILTLRTDKPVSEIGLYEGSSRLNYKSWEAHRRLAETIHLEISAMLKNSERSLKDVGGIVIFAGPGSFTGLRIGFSTANALVYSLNIPITTTRGEDWIQVGIETLLKGRGGKTAMPEYGSAAHITLPKK